RLIERVRDSGLAVLMISHSMPEVFEVANQITILRLGKTVRQMRREDASMTEVVSFMTGAAVEQVAEI
ncbi:MAG: sugar ABC transporter ATP-binding protein, partial [Chloroflexota bacterium]